MKWIIAVCVALVATTALANPPGRHQGHQRNHDAAALLILGSVIGYAIQQQQQQQPVIVYPSSLPPPQYIPPQHQYQQQYQQQQYQQRQAEPVWQEAYELNRACNCWIKEWRIIGYK